MRFQNIVTRTTIVLGFWVGGHCLNLKASELALAWDPPTNNIDGTTLTDLTGYKLYYGDSSGSYSTILDVGNINSCKVTNLLQGSTYYFAVTACVSNDYQSGYSDEFVWSVPDTTPPSISAVVSVSLTADASGMAVVPNFVQDVLVTDNCSPLAGIVLTQTPSAGTLIGTGNTTVLLTATDQASNSSQVTVLVSVSAPPPVDPPPVDVPPIVVVDILPAPWSTQDIGSVMAPGSASLSNNVYTISGAGNVSGMADNFRYVYQVLSGDGEIKARVASLQNAATGAKAGVMIRESPTGGSRQASLTLLANGQVEFLRRTSTGGSVTATMNTGNVAPNNWVRLVRKGKTITAYISSSGARWTSIGNQSITMASTISIGLVTVSGDTNSLSTATIANVTVIP